MKQSNNKTAAIYCRTALKEQHAIESHRQSLMRFAVTLGYTQMLCYVDDGYSGLDFDRPALEKLLLDVQDGKIAAVITKDVSRIGRKIFEVDTFIQSNFINSGIAFHTEAMPYEPVSEYVRKTLCGAIRRMNRRAGQ